MNASVLDIGELEHLARTDKSAFRKVSRADCIASVRAQVQERRAEIRRHHEAGESGGTTLRLLTELCDDTVGAVFGFALAHTANPQQLKQRVALCALGGYGRREMSPHSDLDISLVMDSTLDTDTEILHTFMLPFFWDIGFKAGYTLHSVHEAGALAASDPKVFTTFSQARLIYGDSTTFGRLKLMIGDLDVANREAVLAYVRRRERPEMLPEVHRDLYAMEPDIKENVGGLRDFHAGLWMIILSRGPSHLDELARLGLISALEHLELLEGLDFIWRVRVELHFHTHREEDRLTFLLQRHVATAFGYGDSPQAVVRFMEDYYNAARKVRRFLQIAARICDQPSMARLFDEPQAPRSKFTVYQHQLCVDPSDKNWFTENPSRLIEVIWESVRRVAPLSLATAHWLRGNLHLVNDEFRSSDAVRRYFMAICNRPLQAGAALREAAKTGLLQAYLPEFGAIQGILRYEDFHSYPVDEHTLRALEAVGTLSDQSTRTNAILYRVFERIRDAHVLVMAVLLHDLGKVHGEVHVAAGKAIAQEIVRRIGLEAYDAERIVFLVEHHMVMSDIAFYRDTDDLDVVAAFAETVKTDDLLRMLLLLTYADLNAVGPNVWNDWKAAMLLKLFFRAERILTGRAAEGVDPDLMRSKTEHIRSLAGPERSEEIEGYLDGASERYLLGCVPEQILGHLDCLAEAKQTGFALRCEDRPEVGASEVVVCTRDRHGLFAEIAGAFTSQLVNVRNAALFTREDGWVVDCFLVDNAANKRPLTRGEVESVGRILRQVVLQGHPIGGYVEQSRIRLLALAQSAAAVRPSVEFDNNASKTDTVIDVVAADRVGLLYDIACTLSDMGVDFNAAHIVTDVGRARDAFYVRMNSRKIEDVKLKEWVARRLYEAIAGAAHHEKP